MDQRAGKSFRVAGGRAAIECIRLAPFFQRATARTAFRHRPGGNRRYADQGRSPRNGDRYRRFLFQRQHGLSRSRPGAGHDVLPHERDRRETG